MVSALPLVCEHRPPCPGCPRFGATLDASHPELGELAQLAQRSGIALELGEHGEPLGYRHRARLAVRGRPGAPVIGIFAEGTHVAVDVPRCRVHHPRINETAAALATAMRALRSTPYADATHRGLVRYLQVVALRASERVQVVLVVNGKDPEPYAPLLERLRALLGDRLQGLFVSEQNERSNAILGPRCELVSGEPAVREHIAGAQVFFPPDAFGQSNLPLYERIALRIGSFVPDGADVLEAYAGAGAIGLSLLPRVRRVRFNESAAGSLAGLRMGIAALPEALRARAEIAEGPIARHAELVRDAELVIADPPRKGLDRALLHALCAAPPARFVYLSCGLPALLRDAHELLASGALKLTALLVYDLFPFTAHVETLACFDRA